MPISPASVCPPHEQRQFKRSPALSTMAISALKGSWNRTLSWLDSVKFPELEPGLRNTWRCGRSENPMRFHRVILVSGMRRVWTALESWKNAPKRGDPGDRTQLCIYGPIPAFIPSFPRPLRGKQHLTGIDRWPRSGQFRGSSSIQLQLRSCVDAGRRAK